jgi:mRNA-degrading endonuclease toxin of MazEF toxin-antitoxin module
MTDSERGAANRYALLKERAARFHGDKPSRPIVPGEVYLVDDRLLRFPDDPNREPHPNGRRVIVIQSAVANNNTAQPTVLVLPCSTSWPAGPYDHDFEDDIPDGFTDPPTVYMSLLQPVLKEELGPRQGELKAHEMEPILRMLVDTLIHGIVRT